MISNIKTATGQLAISFNRKSSKYAASEKLKRIIWSVVKIFFIFSPRPFFGWRNFLLKLMGAQIGSQVHIYSSAVIYFPWNLSIGDFSCIGENAFIYNLGKVTIGNNTTVSQRAHLCAGTHDYTRADMLLKKPPIKIGDSAWICADAFIGPSVVVGDGAVVAARAVVVKDVAPWTVVGGHPAVFIKKRVIQQ